ncbi:RNA polymerase sigma factor [Thalassotalea ganghwensis]
MDNNNPQANKKPVTTLVKWQQDLLDLRPALHRYCTQLTGSVFEGEDLLQSVLVKVIERKQPTETIKCTQAWLFSIAYHLFVDRYRATKSRPEGYLVEETVEETIESKRTYTNFAVEQLEQLMSLPPLQRSVLVLVQGFGYSASQSAEILHTSEASVKSALSRARFKLSQTPPFTHDLSVSKEALKRLKVYCQLFNERSFDALLELVIDEVKLDMVAKAQMQGRDDIQFYLNNYKALNDWHAEPGIVNNRPAVLIFEMKISKTQPQYIILVEHQADALKRIQDFRYARYVMESADWRKISFECEDKP